MNELWANFLGYLSLYRSYIIPVFVLGIFLTAIVWVLMKKRSTKYTENPFRTLFCSCVLSLSVAVIIIMTLYGRTQGTEFAFRLRLFGSYIEAFGNKNIEILLQIIMNIVMFVPVGLFLPCCFQKFEKNRFVLLGELILSGTIELIQGITKIGMFEFDDILGNVLGAEIGFGIYWILSRSFRKVKLGRRGNSNEKNKS